MTTTRTGPPGGSDDSIVPTRKNPGRGPIGGLLLFIRQVIAELKKVVRPTRRELVTYTSVVLVFVLIVMTYVATLDFGFRRLVAWAFGGS